MTAGQIEGLVIGQERGDSTNLFVRVVVSCHFLSGCSRLFQDLQLCLTFFLEVLSGKEEV